MSHWKDRNAAKKQKKNYAIITGPCYPNVVDGDNSNKRVKAPPSDRLKFYHDEAVRLSKKFLEDNNGAEGKPVWVEHNPKDRVGMVSMTWVDDVDQLWASIRVPTNTKRGKEVVEMIRAKKLNGFSVGYNINFKDRAKTEIASKEFEELSLVYDPFFANMHIQTMVQASSFGKEETIPPLENGTDESCNYSLLCSLMSSDTPAAEKPATPPTAPGATLETTAAELAKQLDLFKEQTERLKREKEALEQEVKQKNDAELARRKDYAEKQKPVYEELKKFQEEQTGAPVTAEYDAFLKDAALTPEGEPIVASLKAAKAAVEKQLAEVKASAAAAQEAAEKLRKDLETQKEELVNFKKVGASARGAYADSSREAQQPPVPPTKVNASNFSDTLIPCPVTDSDTHILRKLRKAHNAVQVNASKTVVNKGIFTKQGDEFEEAETHMPKYTGADAGPAYLESGKLAHPNSARFVSPVFYNWIRHCQLHKQTDLDQYVPVTKNETSYTNL
jgi:hypothetical protein